MGEKFFGKIITGAFFDKPSATAGALVHRFGSEHWHGQEGVGNVD